VPLHFTQFHPEYLLKNLPSRRCRTLERAKAIADAEGLHYVYIGNVPGIRRRIPTAAVPPYAGGARGFHGQQSAYRKG